MSEPDWQWWASTDEERYQGPYDSREEAIQVATDDEMGDQSWDGQNQLSFFVMEAYQRRIELADHIEIDRIIERWDDYDFEDKVDPDNPESLTAHVTQEQWDDLEARLREVTRAWQAEHRIVVKGFNFDGQRNREHVIVPLPADEGSATTAAGVSQEEVKQP